MFELLANDPDSKARCGKLTTPHGVIETPIFMPVGTQVDPRQHNLMIAGLSQLLNTLQDIYKGHAATATACVGHYTVGAESITAILDF